MDQPAARVNHTGVDPAACLDEFMSRLDRRGGADHKPASGVVRFWTRGRGETAGRSGPPGPQTWLTDLAGDTIHTIVRGDEIVQAD